MGMREFDPDNTGPRVLRWVSVCSEEAGDGKFIILLFRFCVCLYFLFLKGFLNELQCLRQPLGIILLLLTAITEHLKIARGVKCGNGRIVPNTAFIFRVFVATPRTLGYLCIFSSFYLALNLKLSGGE